MKRLLALVAAVAPLSALSDPLALATEAFVTNSIAEAAPDRPVEVPEAASERGVTFVDKYGDDQNASVSLGRGAHAGVYSESLANAPSGTVVRSGSVAIGTGAVAYDASDPYKQQSTAIGWNAHATAINATAIGSGAVHSGTEDPTDPHSQAGNALAGGARSVAIGYGAKAAADGAIQIGTGVNEEANSLKFNGLTIARNGKLNFEASDLSDAAMTAVSTMVGSRLAMVDQPAITTNGFARVTVSSYDESDDSDHMLDIYVNTNATVNTAYLQVGEGPVVEIYKKSSVDALIQALTDRIDDLERRVRALEGN